MPNGQDDLIIPDSVKKRAETADETLYGLKIPESVRGRVAEAANKPKPPVEEKKPGLIKRGLAAVGSVLTNPSYAAAADGQRLADAKPDGQRLVSTKPDAKPDEPSAPTDWRGVDEVDAGGGTTPVFQSGQNPTAAPARGSVLDRPAVAAPPDRMPEEGMLTPEFVRGIRSEFGKIQPEKRFDELRKMASGNGVKAMAARIILRDAEAENMRADFARQERPGMVDGLERAMAAPRIPIKATPGNPPESTVNFPETGALTQWIQQRDAAGVASRHGAARAVADDQRSIDALTQREQAAASDPDAKAFASENPMTSAVASGAANMLRGLDNIVPTVLDFASNLVGAKTSGVKNQSETSAWLERKAQNLMPESGQQEMGAAWHKGEFGEWLMLNLAATAPQLAPTLVAAFVPGTQGAALGLLGGIAAGNKYADTGNSAAAVASGMVEGFSERLPLKYFERSAKALSTLPPAIRGKTVQAIGKALPIVGKHLTAQAVVGTIEEVVAQIGNNGIDATILEKDNTLLDGVAEAAVIGAFASGGLSLPQGAGAIRRAAQSPEQHISQAIDQAAAQFGLNTKAAATLREKTAGMEPEKAASYAEKLFAAAERAGLVKKPGGGSAVRQNAKDLAAKAAKDAEAQQGDASGDSVPAGAAASSDTGLADDMDAGAILGTQAEAPQAASGEAPTEGATDGPMTDEPAQPGVEAGAAPPIEGDLTTGDGQPYGTKASARARATRDGGDVVEVLGGWVVRQSQPSNTRGTNAGDINAVSGTGSGPRPGAGGNAQPGSADTSGSGGTVDVVQGELPQPGATGTAGAVVPGADAGNRPAATGPGAGNEALTARGVMAQVDAVNTEWKDLYRDAHPYFSGDGPTRKLSPSAPQEIKDRYDAFKRNKAEAERNLKALDAPPAAAPTLTAGQSVTVDGEPYTVKTAKPKVLVLTGADGKPRTITSDSATWAKVKPAGARSIGKDQPDVVQGSAPVAQAKPNQEAAAAGGVEPAGTPAAPAVPAAGSAPVEADGVKPTGPVIQNRDRSTPAAITQMRGIAGNPDYLRLSSSRDFTAGAPVIVGSIPLAQMGRKETMAAGKRRIPGVYAVVEAAELVASNSVDGSANPAFEKAATKVIAGNGRTAGLQEAYRTGKAGNYRAELEADESHGINPDVIRGMKAPVLVRVMPASEITDDIGDISNTQAGLQLSAVEQARNDANRVNLDALEFTEDGRITPDTVRRFVQAMPQAEQGNLINRDGSPTTQAVDRLNAVVFFKAYNSEPLTNLYAQTADPDARNIMSALAQAATSMARLEGAGALDIRPLIAEAAEIAINGRRNGLKLSEIAAQDRLDADPDTRVILNLFASNANKVKPVAEALKRAADFAYSEANKPADDMFGSVSQANRGDVVSQIGPRDEARGAQNLEEPAGGKPAGRDAEGQSPEGPGQGNAGAAEEGASAGQAEGLTPAERRKLEAEYQTRATEVLQEVDRRGDLKKLFRSFAGVRTIDGFTELAIDEQASAYADYIEAGAKPVSFSESYTEKVTRMERDALVRRLQSDNEVRQSSGKPFKTEGSAKAFQREHDLAITHEPRAVDGGFVLRLRPPAAQAESRRAEAGLPSYAEAQSAVAAEMGIGETPDGELDATDEQFAEMDRRIAARMRGEAPPLSLTAESEADAQAKAKREADALAAEQKAKADEQARLKREANKREADARAAEILAEREAAKKAEVDAAADNFALGQEPPKPVEKKVAAKDLAGQKDIFGGATPFADPLTLTERQLNSLRGKPITMKAQTEDGQVASWEIDAAEAVQSLRSREATIQQLVRCLS